MEQGSLICKMVVLSFGLRHVFVCMIVNDLICTVHGTVSNMFFNTN